MKKGEPISIPHELELMAIFFSENASGLRRLANHQLGNLKQEEKKKREAVRAKKLPQEEEFRQLDELNRKSQTKPEFQKAVCHEGRMRMFCSLEDESFDDVMSGADLPNNEEEEEDPECECISNYLDRFPPAWAGEAYKFVVTTALQVLEPEAIKRRDASKHLSTEAAITAGKSTEHFLVQLATAIHLVVHWSNLDNIEANAKAAASGGGATKKARGRVTKAKPKELAASYHIWLWALKLSYANGELSKKMAQWDQRFVLQQKFAETPDTGSGDGAKTGEEPFDAWMAQKLAS